MNNRQTPFQQVGQQSYFNPQPNNVNQFYQDYDMYRMTEPQRRPKSRELDLMNLLLIGSMDKSKQKSGLEGLNGLMGDGQELVGNLEQNPFSQQSQNQWPYGQNQQFGQPFPQQQFPQQFQQQFPQQFQQQPFQQQFPQPLPQLPQQFPQFPQQLPQFPQQSQFPQQRLLASQSQPQLDNSISPPTLKNNGQLIINGQMGVNLEQTGMNTQSNRVLEHIQRQNEILQHLTQNMAKTREQQQTEEKQKLKQRLEQMEQLNSQDAYTNQVFDEYPSYKQPQRMRAPMFHNPYQPPPIQQQFQPQGYNNNQGRSKQETLHMLMLMKQMRDMKTKQKKHKKHKEQEYINDDMDSFTSPSEESVEYVPKPRVMRAKPIPVPAPYDPGEDFELLKKLQHERALRHFRIVNIQVIYLNKLKQSWREMVNDKKDFVKNNMPQVIQEFIQSTENWLIKVCKDSLEYLMKAPKLNVQIVPINNKKISESQMKQNVLKLKEVVKKIFDCIVDNSNELEENIVYFLAMISHDYEFLPDNYFIKFEISRLNFNYLGSLSQMNQNKQFMLYCTHILIRILVVRVLSKLTTLMQVQVTDQIKINLKTTTSVIYEIIMLFTRGYAAQQPDNLKYLPIENQVKEKKEIYFQLDQFEASEQEISRIQEARAQKLDEPIAHPLYSNRQMGDFFDNERIFVNTLVQMVEGWCEKIGDQVNGYFDIGMQQKMKENNDRREEQRRQYGMKKDRINQLIRQRWDDRVAKDKQIIELKEKIRHDKEAAEIAQKEYDKKMKSKK